MSDLFNQYQPLAFKQARALFRRLGRYVQREELENAALVGLWQGSQRYRAELGKPESFLSKYIRGRMLDWLRQATGFNRRLKRRPFMAVQLDTDECDPLDGALTSQPDLTLDLRDEVECLLLALPERNREIVCLYFLDGWLMRRIADHVGVTQSQISHLVKDSLERMREFASQRREAMRV